ncbi:BspA family leucine-rich repeat surface protein [Marinicella sp. W31]|uniref:BspA family leucine-rich repeat surface protein n=1 Tax=Marinicella sp. W31 TaxID=3023713 RepID=UPI00375840DB
MKKYLLVSLFFVLGFVHAAPSDDFIIAVDVNSEFTIYELTSIESYNYNIDCDDDGVLEATALTGTYTCQYDSAGEYTIRISDNSGAGVGFTGFTFSQGIQTGNAQQVVELKQWGTHQWSDMNIMFTFCMNMVVTASDSPDLLNVKNMSSMFFHARIANVDVSNWNVSGVERMSFMFANTTGWTPDVSNWDVSQVIEMGGMFQRASAVGLDVSEWDVSSVRNMSRMFFRASRANPNVSNWNVSEVTDMREMFRGAISANPDVSAWDTVSLVHADQMFAETVLANPDLNGWDISSLMSAADMFSGTALYTPRYDDLLAAWSERLVPGRSVVFGAGNSNYCDAVNEKELLQDNGWMISDVGQDCSNDIFFANSFDLF